MKFTYIFFCIVLTWMVPLKVQSQSLVAYYPFSSNARDFSGNGNDGIINNAIPTIDRFEFDSNAYAFNGSTSTIVVPHSSSFVFTGTKQFTISAWVKIKSYRHQVIAFKGDATAYLQQYPHEWAFVLEPDGTARIQIINSTETRASNLGSTIKIELNKWTHIVAIWNGVDTVPAIPILQLYINDQLAGSMTAVNSITSMPSPLYLGYVGDGPLDGALDDIRVYNYALRQPQVDSLYHERGWESGNLKVLVQNGEDWGLAGPNAHIRLYSQSGTLIDSATTNTNSIATFTGVPAGNYYRYEVDYVSTHQDPVVTRQYWGERYATITAGQTTSEIFTRNLPYATNIQVFNSLTNENVRSKSVWQGTPLYFLLNVKNPNLQDAQTQTMVARLVLSANSTPPYIFDETTSSYVLPVGTTDTVGFSFSPRVLGQYYYAGGVKVWYGGAFNYSEGFDEWKTPLFSVITPAVNLLVPSDGAASQPTSLTLRWNRVVGASSYQLQLGTDPGFTTTIVDNGTLTDTTSQVQGLVTGVIYYWRVRAISPAVQGVYTVPFSFTTVLAIPGVPTLIAPADGAPSLPVSITFHWSTVTNIIGYHIQVSSDPQFNTLFVNDSTVSDTMRLVSGLSHNTTYYWRIRTVNTGGRSAFTVPYTFTTIVIMPNVPALVYPVDGSASQSTALNLRWTQVTSSNAYQVQLSSDAQFSTLVLNDSTVTDTTKLVSGLDHNTTYYWRIRAYNAGGVSAFTTPFSFSTVVAMPSTPMLLLPPDGVASQHISLMLQWSRVVGAVAYQLQVSSDAFFITPLINDSTLIDTLRVVSGLVNNTLYYWRVRAINAGGNSGYAAPFSFTTELPSEVVGLPSGIPKAYALYPNYPNPFNPTTKIRYALPTNSNVLLTIFNTAGQVILVIKRGYETAGYHEMTFDGRYMASGVYFYQLRAEKFMETRSLILVK